MANITKRHNPRLILFLILLLAVFMRFYNMYPWLMFGMDQEYQALISKNIVTGRHFPLIGVNASDTGIYLGPFFSYFAALIFMASAGNPVGGAIVASLTGVLTTYVLYTIAKKMFTEQIALVASLLYAGSFLVSFYDRQFWNPNPVPLVSLLVGYFLWRVACGTTRYLPWLAATFAIGIQCHLSLLIFLPIIVYILYSQRKGIQRKTFIISCCIYLLIQAPWIVFELRHDFLNSKAVFSVLNGTTRTAEFVGLIPRTEVFISTIGRAIWTPFFPDFYLESGQCKELRYLRKDTFIAGAGVLLFFGYVFIYRRKTPIQKLIKMNAAICCLGAIGIVTVSYILLYSRQSFEYYYLYLFPWFMMVVAYALLRVSTGRYIYLYGFLTVFVIANIVTLVTATHSFSYKDKVEALLWSKSELRGSPYSLEALGGCGRFGGFRYLAGYIIGAPSSSYMDSYFSWLYPETIQEKKAAKILLLDVTDIRGDTQDMKPLSASNVMRKAQRFGLINALIYEPTAYAYISASR